jgi:rod shape determining protein RodA
MREKSDRIFYNVDWVTVVIYLLLVTMGWFNIYSAVYDEAKSNIFNFERLESKQLVFLGVSIVLAFFILLIDASFFTATAPFVFGVIILLNIAVRFLGTSVKGSYSWFRIGGFGLQPAEFAKWATLLMLAKFLSSIQRPDWGRTFLISVGIILLPMFIIVVIQNETGVALVFTAFVIILYREGIVPGWILLFGIFSAVAMIIGIKYPGWRIEYEAVTMKQTIFYEPQFKPMAWWLGSLIVIGIIRLLFIHRTFMQFVVTGGMIVYLTVLYLAGPIIINKMPEHQSGRIKSWLGLPVPKEQADRFDYNTKQSMIAIGSGGWTGKGYLQGTQTKFRFVPEQETDFIFCTVGEEWGLLGTSAVVILYLILIIRLIIMSERQRSDFTRIYGYGVAAVFFIHLIVNVGMTIGLLPVIGIPLPFFSYGGSSLISFTILLFIFVRLDSQRLLVLR